MPIPRAEAGSRPGGRGTFLCVAKETYPKERRPRCPCPPRPGARGQPAMLGPGVRRRTPCAPSARELRSNSFGEPDNDARVLRHALTPGPALLGTVRRGWERAPYGPLLCSAAWSIAALGSSGRPRPTCRQRAARTDARRSCVSSSRLVPVPHPFWLRRDAQELGWACVPKDTHDSSSSLPMLFERSSPEGGTQRVHRHHPRSEHRRLPAAKRRVADSGRCFFAYFLFAQKESRCAAGRTSRPLASINHRSNHWHRDASRYLNTAYDSTQQTDPHRSGTGSR